MEIKKKIILCFALLITLFVINKQGYAHDYAPMSFNISVERITPIELELENNGIWDLGNYVLKSGQLSKNFYIKVKKSPPNTKVKFTADNGKTAGDRILYGAIGGAYLKVDWTIQNSDLIADSNGEAVANIFFGKVFEGGGSHKLGSYTDKNQFMINVETF